MSAPVSFRGLLTAALYVGVIATCAGTAYYLGRDVARVEHEQIVNEENPELDALRKAFGPSKNSRDAEEWIIRDFFGDERGGVFADVGANHHQQDSNTYYLEKVLGWSGVAIEPQTKFAEGYKQNRPRTMFVPLFVSDVSNTEATLYLSGNDLVASGSREFTQSFGRGATPTSVTTTTLDDVLERLNVTRIDFLTMDIELAEPQALTGFAIDRFKPRLVCIEAHEPVRQQILEYFARHDYVMLGKYWLADSENFWFAPLADSAAHAR